MDGFIQCQSIVRSQVCLTRILLRHCVSVNCTLKCWKNRQWKKSCAGNKQNDYQLCLDLMLIDPKITAIVKNWLMLIQKTFSDFWNVAETRSFSFKIVGLLPSKWKKFGLLFSTSQLAVERYCVVWFKNSQTVWNWNHLVDSMWCSVVWKFRRFTFWFEL